MSVAAPGDFGDDSGPGSLSKRLARQTATPVKETKLLARAIARAKDGDTLALHFLYVRLADEVRAYIQSIVHYQHAA